MHDDKHPADDPPDAFSMNPFSTPADDDAPKDDPVVVPDDESEPDEPKPASLAMTKAELLERVNDLEEKLKKAELLERIQELEGEKANVPDAPEAPAGPLSNETRSATINGRTLTWTDATAHQVPEEYVLVDRRSRGMSV